MTWMEEADTEVTMLRQNHRWTTTLSVAVTLALATWVSASGLVDLTRELRHARDDQRTTHGMLMLDFQRLHERGEVLVVDVRDKTSYEAGRIAGAIHVGVDEVAARVAEVRRLASSRIVVTYCSCPSEASSLRVAQALGEHGLRAQALIGGYHGWVDAGGRTARGPVQR
jgi:rhodanese-related sulfurtransferase